MFCFLTEFPDRVDLARGSLKAYLGMIAHRRAVDAADMQSSGQRDGGRCGTVPLIHAAVVHVDVGLAEYNSHCFRTGRV